MNCTTTNSRKQVTRALAVTGTGAFVLLGVLSAINGGGFHMQPGPRIEAGSGSAPTNTTYQQPVVGGMNLGATATWTTPANAPGTAKAVPPLGGR